MAWYVCEQVSIQEAQKVVMPLCSWTSLHSYLPGRNVGPFRSGAPKVNGGRHWP